MAIRVAKEDSPGQLWVRAVCFAAQDWHRVQGGLGCESPEPDGGYRVRDIGFGTYAHGGERFVAVRCSRNISVSSHSEHCEKPIEGNRLLSYYIQLP